MGLGGGRTLTYQGDEIPLKSPRSHSSCVMVASAWKVERHWAFGAGFWKRYFTLYRVARGTWNALASTFRFARRCVRFTLVKWESQD